ncbi:MAG: ImmA/IrrE family metallo-endopeptidase [Desulfovibrionaceae bacterium]|nr:ImmA/IrrE family metallo-endopeptidase [Desulfovibrionaceae bacterium]
MSASVKAPVSPALLTWARERAGFFDVNALVDKFPLLPSWEKGESIPTLKQVEDFAKTVHIAIGFLFLPSPPTEDTPIADFRTIGNLVPHRLSVNLLDTIYLCQRRQYWYRNYAIENGMTACDFVKSTTMQSSHRVIAQGMRERLHFALDTQKKMKNWEEALRYLVSCVESCGILVMSSSVVGSNTNRTLKVEECRGFSLSDEYAPLIFINSADAKAAQMFTLVHEVAHIWIGQSGISNSIFNSQNAHHVERWCNKVAAEFLLPLEEIKELCKDSKNLCEDINVIARTYKVSTLVAIIRLKEAGLLSKEEARKLYHSESQKHTPLKKSGGGSFFNTLTSRTGRLFLHALLSSTFEAGTLFQEACRLLSVNKISTLFKAARKLGIM